ncbi:MAG: hypothetical protein R8G66_22225 [Cytophagales bacterium]|nr:hypothetical protein [Cytophagales bacterium]
MDTFKKILNLIPDNWKDVLEQADTLEAFVDQGHQFVHSHKEKLRVWIAQLLFAIKVDWVKVEDWLTATPQFAELDKIPLDIKAWMSTPQGFDWEDEAQRTTLIDEKANLLKATFQELSFGKSNGEAVDLLLAVDQLRDLVEVLLNWPEVDFENAEAVQQFKEEVMIEIRPKVFALILTLTGFDLQRAQENNGATKPSFSSRIETVAGISDKLTESRVGEENTALPSEIRQVLGAMQQAQHAMPILKAEFSRAIPELDPLLDRFGGLEQLLGHLQEHFPLITEAIQTLAEGNDWTNLDVSELIPELRQLFTVIRTFLETSSITQQLLTLVDLQQALPVRLVGFEEEKTLEDKLTTWVSEAMTLFTLPEDLDTLQPDVLMAWFRSKVEELLKWGNHVEVLGTTIDNLHQQVKSPIEQLLSTDGADLNSTDGVTNFVLDKLKLILNWISPASEESPENNKVTKDNNPSQAEDVGPGTEQSVAPSSKGMISILVNGLRDSIEKGQLIWQFIKGNDLGISLEEPNEDSQPPALQPTSYSGSVPAPEAKVTDDNASQASKQPGGSNLGEGSTGNAKNTPDPNELISWNQVIMNLLGDRESGVISHLTDDKKDIAMYLKDGEWQQQLEAELSGFWESSGLAVAFAEQIAALRTTLGFEENEADSTPPTLGTILIQLVNGVGLLFETARVFLEKVLQFLVDTLVRLIDMLFELFKAIRVPAELKESLPQPIENILFGENDPNLLCLLLAMPTVVLKGLFDLPIETVKEWMEAA